MIRVPRFLWQSFRRVVARKTHKYNQFQGPGIVHVAILGWLMEYAFINHESMKAHESSSIKCNLTSAKGANCSENGLSLVLLRPTSGWEEVQSAGITLNTSVGVSRTEWMSSLRLPTVAPLYRQNAFFFFFPVTFGFLLHFLARHVLYIKDPVIASVLIFLWWYFQQYHCVREILLWT